METPPPKMYGSGYPEGPEIEVSAAVLEGVKQLRVRKRKLRAPKPGEVQLDMNCVGICGSDYAYWAKGMAGGFLNLEFSEEALCQGYCGQMGHECAGTVIALGEGVTGLEIGDRVALEPGVPCGDCKICRKGRYNLCPQMRFIGSAVNKVPGAMCTKFNHKASYCYKLPPHVSLQEGAMLEPMCVALHAVTRSHVCVGQSVFVSGAGPIGLMTALCARAAGAASITITDMVDAKLKTAKEIGCDHTLRADTANIIEALQNVAGDKFDVCFECCGVPAALNTCCEVATPGGIVCAVANFPSNTSVNLQLCARREIDIVGIYRYCNLYPTALALVASGRVNLRPLISKTYSLDEAEKAFEHFATGEPIKVLIQPNPPEES